MAELITLSCLDILGKINTCMRSPAIQYAAYLVFKLIGPCGFENQPIEVKVGVVGSSGHNRSVYFDIKRRQRLRDQAAPPRVGLNL